MFCFLCLLLLGWVVVWSRGGWRGRFPGVPHCFMHPHGGCPTVSCIPMGGVPLFCASPWGASHCFVHPRLIGYFCGALCTRCCLFGAHVVTARRKARSCCVHPVIYGPGRSGLMHSVKSESKSRLIFGGCACIYIMRTMQLIIQCNKS